MTSIYRIWPIAATMIFISACAGKEKPVEHQQGSLTESGGKITIPDTAFENAKVKWSDRKDHDLTGDGNSELLSVRAFGPAYDSLLVVFEIQGPDGRLLYRDRWSSERYFAYDYRAGKADTTVSRIVLGHLNRLLSDSSLIAASEKGPRGMIDTMAIRYDLAESQVRKEHQLEDTSTLSTAMFNEIEEVVPRVGEVGRIADEVKPLPRFIYFAGGELTYTLAWSESLQRFIRVFSCC